MPHNKFSQPAHMCFGVDSMQTALQKMKARYEYNDEEFTELLKEFEADFPSYAQQGNFPQTPAAWTQRPQPQGEDLTPQNIQKYYTDMRRGLSVNAVTRAPLMQARLNGMEDGLMHLVEKLLRTYSCLRTELVNTMDLSRISKIVQELKGNTILEEALSIPAQQDPDRTEQEMEQDKKWILEVIKATQPSQDSESEK